MPLSHTKLYPDIHGKSLVPHEHSLTTFNNYYQQKSISIFQILE